ncbi:condensation domain-containing protein [Streptomyces sp. RS10V-4]|uniref:condensation domain-containing protein n=1 Tax=Streptomyces rhizoryzae TaxID=2932493 RepID=UPI00200448E6|nr:condensation domain-containing protein [Streptomyces rhizoryzae]MCK7621805.1 condensation domain-containing protein [Streptomyces rhizoryzae]
MAHPATPGHLAVIGVAFEFPGAADWAALTALLRGGGHTMRTMPERRLTATGLTPTPEDRTGGWIEDITGFDHRYFGLSRAEAELIDPRQRRMLQLAVRAIGAAGYAPDELAGTGTAVLVGGYGAPHPSLFNLLPPQEQRGGPATTGSLHAYAAGRISYHLDLRGPAQVIDTSCSSFLVALHEARWKLARGESDLALVGGYELVLGPVPRHGAAAGDGLGVLSGTGHCRPFDTAADGTMHGEGGGFVLVKRLADALRDGDTVHAVIRGSAVNQDAGRSTGLTAPSPAAQAEVVAAAWRDAGVAPADLGYLEAHGTGTRIGDPIEIQGLAAAFGPDFPGVRPLSSVKANLGHLGCMASFAGLVRILAQFRAGEIFPTAHFTAPSDLLALDTTPLRIADRAEPWPAPRGPRLAGLSSFGLSGTNAHMVIEQGRTAPDRTGAGPAAERPVVLSAPTEQGLRDQLRALRDTVAADVDGFDLAAASETLTVGREHFAHRYGVAVRDGAELLDRLDAALHGRGGTVPGPPAGPLVLAVGDLADADLAALRRNAAEGPAFAAVLAAAEAHRPAGEWNAAQRALVALVGAQAVQAAAGPVPDLVLAHGLGKAAVRVAGGAPLGAELDALAEPGPAVAPPDAAALDAALAARGAPPLVLDLAPGSALSALLAGRAAAVADTPAAALCQVYRQGRDVDWRAALGRAPRRRVELPLAALDEEHCWPRTAGTAPAADSAPAPAPAAAPARTVAETVLAFARDVLKEPGLALGDDFFDAGGNSLNGAQLVARLNERYGTGIEVLDLFDLPDLAALAAHVAELAPADGEAAAPGAAPGTPAPARSAPAQPAPDSGPLSGEQTAIWAADRLDPGTGAYNVPAAFLLDRPADPGDLAARLAALVRRHPMLRAHLHDTDDGPRQVVLPPERAHLPLDRLDWDLTAHTAADGHETLLNRLRDEVARPLDPYAQLPARHQLIRVRFADAERDVLMLTHHHLFVDGWSWRILFADLAGQPGAPGTRTFLDHVEEQRALLDSPRGEELAAFWSRYLAGAPQTGLPGEAGTGGRAALPLGDHLVGRVRELAAAERCTPHMVLLAAWVALQWRITGERDVTVAVPAAGRAPADEPVVGNYATTLVVRVQVRPDEPFTALLAAVREASLAALAHQGLPTDRIRRLARPGSARPLAATMFGFNGDVEPLRALAAGGPGVELLDVGQGAATFPVQLSVLEYGDRLRATAQYAPGGPAGDRVRGWLDDYRALLDRLAAHGPAARTAALCAERPAQVAPRTEREAVLARLWATHLKRESVGVTDDFFDLGGDSLLAIAIASQAERLGHPVRPRAILDGRTIEAVAAAAPGAAAPREATGARPGRALAAADGPAELTPPQLEFLARGAKRPDHWNHGVSYGLGRTVTLAQARRALAALAARHPALRTRLTEEDGRLRQYAAPQAPDVTEFDLRALTAEQALAELDERAGALHEALDLREGPVTRAALVRLPDGTADRLLLIVHHLAVDLYSWNVLTEELDALLRDGDDRALGAPGPSCFQWADRLGHWARTRPDALDGGYWLDRAWGEDAQRATVPDGPSGTEGNTRELTTCHPLPAADGHTLYALLLSALGGAFQEWLGVRGGEVAVQLVAHGREDLFDDLELGRTVGYFNTTYPFALALPGRRDRAAHRAHVAAELRAVPRSGFDFEVLRHHHPDPGVRRALGAIPVPGVLFSFWGAPAFRAADGVLRDVDTERVGRDRPADMERPCPLEVYPSVDGDRLTVLWRYSGELFDAARIGRLADAYAAALTDRPGA